MSRLFAGFTQSDFSAFREEKRENPKFNKERKTVWQKMRKMQPYLDIELKQRGLALEGKVSQYWINYTKRRVNGIWLAYTDVKPYYIVCQLNCGIYKDGFFAGIEINWKAKHHLENVAEFIRHNKDEFLSYVNKLDPDFMQISYGSWSIGSGRIRTSDLDGLLDTLEYEKSWFNLGEWYPKAESFLKSSEIIPRIIKVLETLYPLYLVFAGRRPIGKRKIERLQRVGDVMKEDLVRTEKELVTEISQLSGDEVDELIANIDKRNRTESASRDTRETRPFRRDPALSATLKTKYKDRCQICHTTYRISRGFFCDTHHIKPLSAGGMDVSANILVLCPNHHRLFDRSPIKVISRDKSKIKIKVGEQVFEVKLR